MISYLDDNPVGKVLAGVSAGLLGVLVLLGVVWALPPSGSGAGESEAGAGLSREVPQLATPEPIENYAEITNRPVFNESRQPELEVDAEGEGDGENPDELAAQEVDAPELELAGVIITPSLRMVTLRQKKVRESLVAFEGQPLQGDFGTWHVSRIAPREITLAAGDGREVQLQLQIHDAKIKPPPKPKPAEVAAEQPAQEAADAAGAEQPMTRAEEIRQRIAERREELRRAAEAEKSGEKKGSDYQTAIQAMIGTGRKPKEKEDDQ